MNCDPEDLPEALVNAKVESSVLRDLKKGKSPAADAAPNQVRNARYKLFLEADNLLVSCLSSIEAETNPADIIEFMDLSRTCAKVASVVRGK